MVELILTDDVAVIVESGDEKSFAYTVVSSGEEIVSYETSADVRKPAGKVGLRNVICRQVSGLEKEPIESALDEAVRKHEADIGSLE
ncbi:hypothetical protein [Natronosalvus vescus]|uniref:hypothetical protein n=1 Tax=Natronosalvus vescus TaxID=2953881 RepID=UPI002091A2F6|nr:hypothetical protein [Natronosalvus vescus]